MTVSVNDMHTSAMKFTTADLGKNAIDFQKKVAARGLHIGNIDISTQDGASEAMYVIKNAANYISDVRGSLGALQNRLDHTINNLWCSLPGPCLRRRTSCPRVCSSSSAKTERKQTQKYAKEDRTDARPSPFFRRLIVLAANSGGIHPYFL